MIKEQLQEPIPVLDSGWVRYIDHMGTDYTSAYAARQSFDHDKEKRVLKDEHLNRHLIGSDPMHGVPFEHIQLQIQVKLPLVFFVQWFKHRVQSQSEQPYDMFEMRKVAPASTLSGRYQTFQAEFYSPGVERMVKQSNNNKQGSSSEPVEHAQQVRQGINEALLCMNGEYKQLTTNDKLTNEVSRLVLTNAHYTTMTVTASVRAWLDFCRQRCDEHAQWEIRQYANVVSDIVETLWPNIHAGWVWFVRDSVRLSVGQQKALADWVLSERKLFKSEADLVAMRRQWQMGARESRALWAAIVGMGLAGQG